MKNKLFFSSLIITSMVFSLVNVSLADGNDPLSSDDITMTLPEYISVTTTNSSVLSGTATITNGNLTLSTPITSIFNVSTTDPDGIKVRIGASAPVAGNSSVTSDITNGKIIFTKADGTTTSNAATNIKGSPTAANNPDAIAFPISCTSGDDSYNNGIVYNVTGSKEITCSVSGDAISNTFASNDTKGSYSANLHFTQLTEVAHQCPEGQYWDECGTGCEFNEHLPSPCANPSPAPGTVD